MFETIKSDTVEKILSYINENSNHKKGEFVVIIPPSGVMPLKVEENDLKNALSITQDYLPTSQSVKLISLLFKKNKKEVYNLKKDVVGVHIKPDIPKKPHIILENNFDKSVKHLSKLLLNKLKKRL